MLDLEQYNEFIPAALRSWPHRKHLLDGKLLLFDRFTGTNILLEGNEFSGCTRQAPRTLLIAITNACNLTCSFCYRDLSSRSQWDAESLLSFLKEVDKWGVLEVALGGGEPLVFPKFTWLIEKVFAETGLCLNFTTNGTRLTDDFLRDISGLYGQIKLSIYSDNHPVKTIELLRKHDARFGVNWLITEADFPYIEERFQEIYEAGARDILILRYKGADQLYRVGERFLKQLKEFICNTYAEYGNTLRIGVDVCWGSKMSDVPLLFATDDCGAGDDFLSITSDRKVKICSFQETSEACSFESVADLRCLWKEMRSRKLALSIPGCGRGEYEDINLATI
jgi:MoaA/NifB/PqqE/SkfB family radical SAM enzyme